MRLYQWLAVLAVVMAAAVRAEDEDEDEDEEAEFVPLVCTEHQQVFHATDIVRATAQCPAASAEMVTSMCEKAVLRGTPPTAYFPNLTNSAPSHHRLVHLPIRPTNVVEMEPDTRWAASIAVEGNFTRQACNPTGAGDDYDCDLVVGLTDMKTVYAVSRGVDFLDTLVPFADNFTRPSTGYFFDPYARPYSSGTGVPLNGNMTGGFTGIVNQTLDGAVLVRLFDESDPVSKADTGRHFNAYTTGPYKRLDPRGTSGDGDGAGLNLVLYRDEQPQAYSIDNITVTFYVCTGGGRRSEGLDGGLITALVVILSIIGVGVAGGGLWMLRRQCREHRSTTAQLGNYANDLDVPLDTKWIKENDEDVVLVQASILHEA